MREKLKKIWRDPVGSKIIANLIWIILLALGTFIYLFYKRISQSISFNESWNRLLLKLGEERVITNGHYLIGLLIAIVLLINRTLLIKIIVFIFKAVSGVGRYHQQYEYHFSNQGKRTSGIISSQRSSNLYKIKPQDGTKDWSLKILFSHLFSALEKEEEGVETIRIYKKYSKNKLILESYQKNGKKGAEMIELLDNYIDQEFELRFDFSYEKGGIILKVKRHMEELYASDVKYGCTYFRVVAEDSNFDFDLKINYERFE